MRRILEELADDSGITQYVAPNNKYLERYTDLVIDNVIDGLAKELREAMKANQNAQFGLAKSIDTIRMKYKRPYDQVRD